MKTALSIVFFICTNVLFVNAQQQVCMNAMANVNTDSLVFFMKNITGKQPVMIGDSEYTIFSRMASHPSNNIAANYLKQTVMQYGFEVEDIPYSPSGRNIIAYKSGTVNAKKAYLIGAHYDCVGTPDTNFEGADDNGSGVAALLEIARVLQHEEFPYTIILAFWDEEEIGLVGSEAFAPDGPIGFWDTQAAINLDMIAYDGNNDSLAMVHTKHIANSEILADKIIEVNNRYQTQLNIIIKNPGTTASDHQSFWVKGSTAIGLGEDYDHDFSPNWHQPSDSLGNLNIPYFTKLSKLACAAICEISQTGNIVSVHEAKPFRFSLSPNPAKGFLELPSAIDWNKGIVSVYNIMGELVLSPNIDQSQLAIESLTTGFYSMMIKTPNGTYISKFIKQ
jgi:hypothetical protein